MLSTARNSGLYPLPKRAHKLGGKAATVELGRDGVVRGTTVCNHHFEMPYTIKESTQEISFAFDETQWEKNATECNRADFAKDFHYRGALIFERVFPGALRDTVQYYSHDDCRPFILLMDTNRRTMMYLEISPSAIPSYLSKVPMSSEPDSGAIVSSLVVFLVTLIAVLTSLV